MDLYPARVRWALYALFVGASVLNFLDRQVLAALAPQLMREFSLTKGQYGDILLAFSLTYAALAPLAGWLIDRAGLARSSVLLVGLWSLAGMSMGLAGSFGALLAARAFLGAAESGSISLSSKANALYLAPRERSVGTAVNQVGLALGAILAPWLGQALADAYGWRWAFIVPGALGFLWIPAWLAASRRFPAAAPAPQARESHWDLLRDPRFWLLLAANMAVMTIYTLWVNWTTVFLVTHHGMTQAAANQRLAWIPQVFGTAGGLLGGWLSLRWASGEGGVTRARLRACFWGALLAAVIALLPYSPTPGVSTAGICVSFFACLIVSVNLYALPLDFFGAGRAAFATAGLTASYGVLQAVFSPVAGRVVDRFGFAPLFTAVALLPLAGYALLRAAGRRR